MVFPNRLVMFRLVLVFRLALVFCMGELVGCRNQRMVHVLNFPQAKALGAEYLRRYDKRQRPAYWVGPPPSCVYLRRNNITREPIILGQVDELLENGALLPSPSAIIIIDKIHTSADEAGNYRRTVSPGAHTMRVGWPGLLWSVAPPLRVAQGDSIRINFKLMPDPRPTID